tara:strand:- start:46 stop:567 length:522 start_codon:yes stop_codon:yes gene_type:complete
MHKVILISGGRKSGKSQLAENIAKKINKITYVALSEFRPDDKDWQERITKHRLRRPSHWNTIETDDLIKALKNEKNALLIDSIGGFVVKNLSMKNDMWEKHKKNLLIHLNNYHNQIIIVAEQVGWGLVSEYKIGNLFADRLGDLIKDITNISDENWLAINGKALKLDDIVINI